jgi:hypothetical protein
MRLSTVRIHSLLHQRMADVPQIKTHRDYTCAIKAATSGPTEWLASWGPPPPHPAPNHAGQSPGARLQQVHMAQSQRQGCPDGEQGEQDGEQAAPACSVAAEHTM